MNRTLVPQGRIESIDVLRGFVIMLMMFVNDLAGVGTAPAWLKHVSASADAMTIADLVFPAFLFLVGMATPLALGRRFESGQNRGAIALHVLIRGASLLFIGVLYMNRPGDSMGWRPGLWKFLMFSSVMMAWHSMPKLEGGKRTLSTAVRWAGIAVLAFCVIMFRDNHGGWLRTGWWGILGLIGWAYMVGVLVYALAGDNRFGLLGVAGLLFSLYVAMKEGMFSIPFVNADSIGSLPAITVLGLILGTIIRSQDIDARGKIKSALIFALCMYVAGWLLRPLYGVNKVQATPSWCLWCSAFTTIGWVALYWLIDLKKAGKGFKIVGAAGRNALFAYVLSAVIPTFFLVAGIPYERLGESALAVGLARSIVFALAMIGFAAAADSVKLRLKL